MYQKYTDVNFIALKTVGSVEGRILWLVEGPDRLED